MKRIPIWCLAFGIFQNIAFWALFQVEIEDLKVTVYFKKVVGSEFSHFPLLVLCPSSDENSICRLCGMSRSMEKSHALNSIWSRNQCFRTADQILNFTFFKQKGVMWGRCCWDKTCTCLNTNAEKCRHGSPAFLPPWCLVQWSLSVWNNSDTYWTIYIKANLAVCCKFYRASRMILM